MRARAELRARVRVRARMRVRVSEGSATSVRTPRSLAKPISVELLHDVGIAHGGGGGNVLAWCGGAGGTPQTQPSLGGTSDEHMKRDASLVRLSAVDSRPVAVPRRSVRMKKAQPSNVAAASVAVTMQANPRVHFNHLRAPHAVQRVAMTRAKGRTSIARSGRPTQGSRTRASHARAAGEPGHWSSGSPSRSGGTPIEMDDGTRWTTRRRDTGRQLGGGPR